MSFLRLTGMDDNPVLINIDRVESIYIGTHIRQTITNIGLSSGVLILVRETVSEISLLLQAAGRVIK